MDEIMEKLNEIEKILENFEKRILLIEDALKDAAKSSSFSINPENFVMSKEKTGERKLVYVEAGCRSDLVYIDIPKESRSGRGSESERKWSHNMFE